MAETIPGAADIPSALVSIDQWVCWRTQERDGKETKVPINSHTGRFGSATDPETWATFETARRYAVDNATDGVGFVFTADDPFVGVDLDDCRVLETGTLTDDATEIVETLASYTEVSPSGTGVHVLVEGAIPGDRNRSGDVELYDAARFFTVTGDHVDGTPLTIEQRYDEVRTVYREYVRDDELTRSPVATTDAETTASERDAVTGADTQTGEATVSEPDDVPPAGGEMGAGSESAEAADSPTATRGRDSDASEATGATATRATETASLSDEELLQRARDAANGAKFRRLWRGDTSGYESHSEADMALCSLLAFWSGADPEQIDRLFRESGLMREKWDERHFADGSTYGEKTIERVVAGTDEVYEPSSGDATGDGTRTDEGYERHGNTQETTAAEAQLRQRVAELEARDEQRLSVIADLREQVDRLDAENQRLQAQLDGDESDDAESSRDDESRSASGNRLRRWFGFGS